MATLILDIKNVPIELKDKVVIESSEYGRLKQRADYDCWWTTKDLKQRYGHDLNWFKTKILYRPEFKNVLATCVIEPSGSGKGGWQFEPTKFSRFMREQFREIGKGF